MDNLTGSNDDRDISRRGFLGVAGASVAAALLASVAAPLSAFGDGEPKKPKLDERVADFNVSISYLTTTGGIYDPTLPEGTTEIPPLEPAVNGLTPVNYTGLVAHLGPTDREHGNRGRYLSFNNHPRATLEGVLVEKALQQTKRDPADTDETYHEKVQTKINDPELLRGVREQLDPRLLEAYRTSPDLGNNITVRVLNPNFGNPAFEDDAYEMPSATYEFTVPQGMLKTGVLSLKLIGPVQPGVLVGIYLEKVGSDDPRQEIVQRPVTNTGSASPQPVNLPELPGGRYRVTIEQLASTQYRSNLLIEELGISGKLHKQTAKRKSL